MTHISRRASTVCAILIFMAPHAFGGNLYKWVDKSGQVHYTDSKESAQAEAGQSGGQVEEKDLSKININVVPQAEWPASIFSDRESSEARAKSAKGGARKRPETLPWFTESDFESQVLWNRGLTLVEFWAVWCGVCRKVDPIIDEVAGHFGSRVKFGRVDIDKDKKLQSQYQVRGVPNLVFFKDGKVVGRLAGGYKKETYIKMIESNL